MAVPAYRDLLTVGTYYDSSRKMLLSDTISNLARRWGSDAAINEAINTIASINVDFGPSCQGKYVTPKPDSFATAVDTNPFPSTRFAYITGSTQYQPFLGTYQIRDNKMGTVNNLSGPTWVNVGLQSRFVLSGLDRSRFINVPSVNARKLDGATCGTKELKTYVDSFAAEYPYITEIYYTTYYKPDLNSTSFSAFNIGLVGNEAYLMTKYDIYGANASNRYKAWGHYNRNVGYNTLIRLPVLNYGLIAEIPFRYSVYLANLTMANPSMYRYCHFQEGDYEARRQPFVYTTVADVKDAMNKLGLWWGEDSQAVRDAMGENTTSEYVHAPQIDDNGYVYDDWFSGNTDPDLNTIYKNYDPDGPFNPLGNYDLTGNNNVGNNYPLKPEYETQNPEALKPGDEELELEDTDYNGVGLFGTYWCGSRASIRAFNDKLWNVNEPNFILQVLEGLKLYGSDPVNSIMSLRLYPFNVGMFAQTEGYHNVLLGTVDMGFQMLKISDAASVKFELGSMQIAPKYNNFLDLAPYTAMTLYVPFVGSMQLNVNDFIGKTLRVQMTVDLTTGQCVACIYANETPMMHSSGQIGVEIPISAKTFADISMAVVESAATAIVGAATGMIGVASAINFKNFETSGAVLADGSKDASHFETAFTSEESSALKSLGTTVTHNMGELFFGGTSIDRTGSISSGNSMTMPVYCYLIVSRPNVEMPENYDHTYGKVCHKSGQLINFSGYTVCSNVDTTGISATEQERSAIKAFLESGVYV